MEFTINEFDNLPSFFYDATLSQNLTEDTYWPIYQYSFPNIVQTDIQEFVEMGLQYSKHDRSFKKVYKPLNENQLNTDVKQKGNIT